MSFFQMKGGRAGGSRHVVACISKEDFNSGDYPSYKKATPCDGGTMMRVVMSMQHFAEHEEASKNRIKLWMQGLSQKEKDRIGWLRGDPSVTKNPFKGLNLAINGSSSSRRRTPRTQEMRNKRLSENWALMLPDLSKAYLERQQRPQGTTSPDTSSGPSEGAAVISTAAPSEYDCELDTIDVFNLSTFITLGGRTEDSPSLAEEMVSEGYIVNAPFSPSVAVSIETLELYRWIAHRHPTFTLQTFARITSCLYNIPFIPRQRTVIAAAYSAYLLIIKKQDSGDQAGSEGGQIDHVPAPACLNDFRRQLREHEQNDNARGEIKALLSFLSSLPDAEIEGGEENLDESVQVAHTGRGDANITSTAGDVTLQASSNTGYSFNPSSTLSGSQSRKRKSDDSPDQPKTKTKTKKAMEMAQLPTSGQESIQSCSTSSELPQPQRKKRSDAGKTRGPRKPSATGDENRRIVAPV